MICSKFKLKLAPGEQGMPCLSMALKMDPKLGFWVDSKKATLNKDFDKFFIKLGIFKFRKNHTLIKDMGSKLYPNPMFIVGKKTYLISYFY